MSHVPDHPVDDRVDSAMGGRSADTATGVTSYLLAGPLGFGAAGYGLDRWWGTSFLVAIGVLVGMGLALYVIWLRYGTS